MQRDFKTFKHSILNVDCHIQTTPEVVMCWKSSDKISERRGTAPRDSTKMTNIARTGSEPLAPCNIESMPSQKQPPRILSPKERPYYLLVIGKLILPCVSSTSTMSLVGSEGSTTIEVQRHEDHGRGCSNQPESINLYSNLSTSQNQQTKSRKTLRYQDRLAKH